MKIPLKVLIAEDSEDDALLLIRELQRGGYDPIFKRVDTSEAMKEALDEQEWDIVISDYVMPKFSGLAALAILREKELDLPFIIVSGNIGEDIAVEAMKAGAHDYIMKDNLSRLIPAIYRELNEAEVREKRRQAEKSLRESEEKFRTLIENVNVGICRTTADGCFIEANPAIVKIFGYDSVNEFMKIHALDLYQNPEERKIFAEEISRKGFVKNRELKYLKKDGTPIWASITAKAHYDEEGNTEWIDGVVEDITERKNAEKILKDSEKRLRSVIHSSPVPQFVIDKDHRVIYWNKALEECTGIKAGEVIGTKKQWRAFYNEKRPCLADLILGGDIREISELYNVKCFESELLEEAYECIDFFPILGKGGKWLYFTAATIKDTNGNVAGAVETLEDITERKKAEEALRQSEEQYRALYENNPSMYFTVSAEGTVLSVNHFGCQQLGYTAQELIGQSVLKVFYEEDKEHAVKSVKRCVENPGHVFRWELRKVRKDGSMLWVKETARAIRRTDGKVVVFIVCEDITEHKKVEQAIRKSLEEKEVLLREINHRVKNNMQIVSSLLRLQSRYIEDEKTLELFRDSQNRVKSMALVHEKLYQSEDLAEIDFEEYIKNLTFDLLRSYGAIGKISLNINVDKISLGISTAVPCGLIINELVTNSLKHAFPDESFEGPEEIKGEINIDLHKINEKFRLTVNDNGMGLPENFNFKESKTLGLRLVDSLTQQLNGKIEIIGEKGTTFKITFAEI